MYQFSEIFYERKQGVRELTNNRQYPDMEVSCKRLAKVLEYNVPLGKKSRGLTTVACYKALEDPENLTSENIRLANVMGWCVEMVQLFCVIVDDVADSSTTRRGLPCWYLVEGVGMTALNDACMVRSGVYLILKKYFSNHHCYIPVVTLFMNIIVTLNMGQALDLTYTFELPILLAMHMAKKYDPEMVKQVSTVLLSMGRYFQIQDDYLDCFGNPSVMGKNSTDIQDGKCSWLAVEALQRVSPKQRVTFEQNYGRTNSESVMIIRNLYKELDRYAVCI
ncbi:hypothetical protein PPYR_00208 [Photinus pyralis]|uniref:Farnesyl pyrophosphate synthase n=1 Tax=Photinus pyralis TaxID=7054 RepID=A0A5N4B145_PHOPY|nr:hypothetical protein PPYR_00208 [Photinus pyralis]